MLLQQRLLCFALHNNSVDLLAFVERDVRSGRVPKFLQVHGILYAQVGVGIVSKGHTHEHTIQNPRKSLNDEIEALLVRLKQLLLQLILELCAAIELTILRSVLVFWNHIPSGIFLFLDRVRIHLGPAVLFVNQTYYTLKLKLCGNRHPLTIVVRKQIKH